MGSRDGSAGDWNRLAHCVFAGVLGLGVVGGGLGAVINVPDDYAQIQAAIDAANEGDTVLVQPGTYIEALDFLGKGITVTGTAPEAPGVVAQTVVRAPSSETQPLSVVTFQSGEGQASVLAGLKLTNGDGKIVGGEWRWSTVGGGIYCRDSDPTLTHCLIVGNRALGDDHCWEACGAGAGLFCEASSPSVINCTITMNSAAHKGGGLSCHDSSSPTLTSCTITNNFASSGGGGLFCSTSSSPTFSSCILWGNTPQEINPVHGDVAITFSDIQGGWTGEGNIDSDPIFCSVTCGEVEDLRLAAESPCLGTGFQGADMGAWGLGCEEPVELFPGILNVPGDFGSIAEALAAACDLDTVLVAPGTYVESNLEIPEFGVVVRSWDPRDSVVVASTVIAGYSQTVVLFNAGFPRVPSTLAGLTITGGRQAIACRYSSPIITNCTIVDNSGDWILGAGLYCVGSSPIIRGCRITGNAADAGGGLYCFNSAPTLVNSTINGNVGGGLYCTNSSPSLSNCTIEGNTYRGLYCSNSSPILTNCTITGNWALRDGGGLDCLDSSPTLIDCSVVGNTAARNGGGLSCRSSSPTLTSCTITGNSADLYGGGAHCEASSPTFTNCRIGENSSGFRGGGLHCINATPTLANSTIVANSSDYEGGGAYCDASSPMFTNCTIADNSCPRPGAGLCCRNSPSPTLINCILWNDTRRDIYVYIGGNDPVVSYSNIKGGWEGQGNTSTDPVLISWKGFEQMPNPVDRWIGDTYFPRSPCIDAGDPAIEDGISDWHPRWPNWYPNGPRSDMGVYGGPSNRDWVKR